MLHQLHKLCAFTTTKGLDEGHEDKEAYHEEWDLLGCDAVQFGDSPTFRWASVGNFLALPLDSEDGCDTLLRNVLFSQNYTTSQPFIVTPMKPSNPDSIRYSV